MSACASCSNLLRLLRRCWGARHDRVAKALPVPRQTRPASSVHPTSCVVSGASVVATPDTGCALQTQAPAFCAPGKGCWCECAWKVPSLCRSCAARTKNNRCTVPLRLRPCLTLTTHPFKRPTVVWQLVVVKSQKAFKEAIVRAGTRWCNECVRIDRSPDVSLPSLSRSWSPARGSSGLKPQASKPCRHYKRLCACVVRGTRACSDALRKRAARSLRACH